MEELKKILVCPACRGPLDWENNLCKWCREHYGLTGEHAWKGVPSLLPRMVKQDRRYLMEFRRYNTVALEIGPDNYEGYAESKPKFRATMVLTRLMRAAIPLFLNVGPGFGELEHLRGCGSYAIDPCYGFLEHTLKRNANVRCVHGVAEYLPFPDESLPCIVAESVFQSIVDRERFLYEAARVILPGGSLMMGIGYHWNYPSRPQQGFNVLRGDEEAMLFLFLKRLGFGNVQAGYWDLGQETKASYKDSGDYLWIHAKKAT